MSTTNFLNFDSPVIELTDLAKLAAEEKEYMDCGITLEEVYSAGDLAWMEHREPGSIEKIDALGNAKTARSFKCAKRIVGGECLFFQIREDLINVGGTHE